MEGKDITTTAELVALVKDLESNVVSTGVGSLPNNPENGDIQMYFKTAMDAARSKLTDPMKMLDAELTADPSPRLKRLVATTAVAKEKARFAVKPAPKQKAEPGTTIYVGQTIIRPAEPEARPR